MQGGAQRQVSGLKISLTYFSLIPLCKAQSQFEHQSIDTDGAGAWRCNMNQHGRRMEWLHRLAAVFLKAILRPISNITSAKACRNNTQQQQQHWRPIFVLNICLKLLNIFKKNLVFSLIIHSIEVPK